MKEGKIRKRFRSRPYIPRKGKYPPVEDTNEVPPGYRMCTACHDYSQVIGTTCTRCHYHQEFDQANMTVGDWKTVDKYNPYIVERFIEVHFQDLFNIFTQRFHVKFRLPRKAEFVVLRSILQGKSTSECIQNLTLHVPMLTLTAEQAAHLMYDKVKTDPNSNPWQWIHVIGPLVIDPWNLPPDAYGTMQCYYSVPRAPNSIIKLFMRWSTYTQPLVKLWKSVPQIELYVPTRPNGLSTKWSD